MGGAAVVGVAEEGLGRCVVVPDEVLANILDFEVSRKLAWLINGESVESALEGQYGPPLLERRWGV